MDQRTTTCVNCGRGELTGEAQTAVISVVQLQNGRQYRIRKIKLAIISLPTSTLYFFQHATFISHLGEKHKCHIDLTGTFYIIADEIINIREVSH